MAVERGSTQSRREKLFGDRVLPLADSLVSPDATTNAAADPKSVGFVPQDPDVRRKLEEFRTWRQARGK